MPCYRDILDAHFGYREYGYRFSIGNVIYVNFLDYFRCKDLL